MGWLGDCEGGRIRALASAAGGWRCREVLRCRARALLRTFLSEVGRGDLQLVGLGLVWLVGWLDGWTAGLRERLGMAVFSAGAETE